LAAVFGGAAGRAPLCALRTGIDRAIAAVRTAAVVDERDNRIILLR
jgi:hypothetical protein